MPIDAKPEQMGIPDEAYTPPPSMARSASDWATSAIRGLALGGISTATTGASAISDVADPLREKLGEKAGVSPETAEKMKSVADKVLPYILPQFSGPTSDQLQKKIESVTGKFEQPKTEGGRIFQSVGEFVAPSALGKGKALTKILGSIGGGIGSEELGKLASKVSDSVAPYARFLGGVVGQGFPGGVKRIITPLPISDERKALVDALRLEKIEPSAGDVSGSKALKYAEHALGEAPGSGGVNREVREKIKDNWTRAVLRRVGEDSPRATPEVIDRAFTRIGKEFDDLAARNVGHLDNQYIREVMDHRAEYDHLFDDPLKKPIVAKIEEMATKGFPQNTVMDGKQYQALSSRLRRLQRSYHNDPELSDFFGDMHRSLDDMMERSLAKNNPKDLGAWKEARRQYRNLLPVEKAVTGAADEGWISPAKLKQAIVSQSRRGYARGKGDFAGLVYAGDNILKPPPTSGSSERVFLHAIPAALGAGLGQTLGGAPEAFPAALAGVMAPGVTGRAIMSPAVQSYLKNQRIRRDLSPGFLDNLIRSSLAAKAESND